MISLRLILLVLCVLFGVAIWANFIYHFFSKTPFNAEESQPASVWPEDK